MARWQREGGAPRRPRSRGWRARPGTAAEAAQPLGVALRALLAAMGGTPARAGLQNLWDNWEQALGAELASLAQPLGQRRASQKGQHGQQERSGQAAVLLLGAEDAMLLQELRFRREEILERVNAFLGHAYFCEVEVSLPLGRQAPVRTRPLEKRAQRREAAPVSGAQPSGIFLEAMEPGSPVARCYARFAGKVARGNGQDAKDEGG